MHKEEKHSVKLVNFEMHRKSFIFFLSMWKIKLEFPAKVFLSKRDPLYRISFNFDHDKYATDVINVSWRRAWYCAIYIRSEY